MINKTVFTFPSKDGIHTIHATRWQNEGEPLAAVLQIVHGMAEHIDRYDEFARFLAQKGILVVGDDHLGHGRSAKEYGDYGYFCEKKAADILVEDEHTLRKLIQDGCPDVPYYILGHSMGSLILRNYMTRHADGLKGVVICGTADNGRARSFVGRMLSGAFRLFGKSREKSAFIDKIVFGSYNKLTDRHTEFDWLNTDEKSVEDYMKDPECGFLFTVNGFDTLFTLAYRLKKKSLLKKIPKDLPVFMIAGMEDPVGKYGKGVENVYREYQSLGIRDVELKLYEHARHEILLEPQREQIFADIAEWLGRHGVKEEMQ